MSTFLRLKLSGTLAPDEILINVDHIICIYPSTSGGSIITTTEPESMTISVKMTLGELQTLLSASNGRVAVMR